MFRSFKHKKRKVSTEEEFTPKYIKGDEMKNKENSLA